MVESLMLSRLDIVALAIYLSVWVVHALAANGHIVRRVSLTTAMNAQRLAWMRTMGRRELRMIDTSIMVGLQQGTAFFASSSLIALGGCFAILRGSDNVLAVVSDLPLTDPPSQQLFEMKVFGLIAILAYAFFKFGWSYRLFNYCSILVGAVPMHKDSLDNPAELEAAIERAARMNMLAGAHFNAGLRGIFFSIAYLGWFLNPLVFIFTTLLLFAVLLRRQFFSEARRVALGEEGSMAVRQ
ncbi:DUF599 family protein [Mesorhizobium sp. LHD-90]|uniref:DUF599 domain-containing protein n=1 Tax=Mesorhizobium sp. LHD-90 TaxID=3071414 RepID=UPI0027E08043|nr:DUF599 family protein [Mesorhizobium sp. LHD-90]MDQ6437853.1 DUF599 family protein [Mesorhizobium sp. LHD-90]